MRSHVFELSALCAYGGAIAFLYKGVTFLGERDYVAGLLAAGVGLAVARLGGELLRFALWRAWLDEQREETPDDSTESRA